MTEPTDAEIDTLLRPFYESDDAAEMAKYDDRLTARAVLAKWGTPQPTQAQAGAVPLHVDALAQEIRRVDGRHDLGAGALAESLMPFLSAHGIKGGKPC